MYFPDRMSGYRDGETERIAESCAMLRKPFTPDDPAGKQREAVDVPGPSARILIADDEPGIRRFLRIVLEKCGFEVIEAVDGAEAMKEVRRGAVALVLIDLIMPDQEGIETIRKMRREKPGLRIIAMSGKPDYLRVALTLGADAALEKPISPDALRTRIRALLEP